MSLTRDGVRRALRDRVAARVAGRGVMPDSIQRAVDAVVAALPADALGEAASEAGDGAAGDIVLAVTASSVPDLASRVRRQLEGAGVRIADSAAATAGRHTVVTVRIPASMRPAAEQAARSAGWTTSVPQ